MVHAFTPIVLVKIKNYRNTNFGKAVKQETFLQLLLGT